ncbi:MAG: ABC-F family ATP-binding cassette domain-containing protein, partial [Planctomycetota bacterium]
LLIVQDVKKHFAAQEVLSGVNLRIDPAEKIGIVGRNGGGKSTLLRLIEGLDQPDWGSLTLRKGARLGHVPQRPHFDEGVTPLSYVESGLAESRSVIDEFERVGIAMGDASPDELEKLMARHEELSGQLETLGGWDVERRVETVLSGIGLREDLWEREARTMSGGEKSRVALARELIAGHDILLLDEPTNHLDLRGIEWLEDYLRDLKSAVLIVSHDRRLLDNAVSAIVELERGKLERYPGNYSRYVDLKAERFESERRAFDQQQDFLRKEEAFIKKHMGSQRTAEAKGRQKKLSHIERLECPHHDVRRPVIRIKSVARGGEMVLRTEGLAAGYKSAESETRIVENADLRIGRGQRVGIVGANGTGKTTLLKVLAGQTQALAGTLEYGHGAACAYFDQESSDLRDDGTPYTEIRRNHGAMTDLQIRNHLARFLFRGDEIDKAVPTLSGGERARLRLAQLMLTEPSWMALDEPTNHLDLASRTALEEFLGEFTGSLVCISHDREFLDGLCTHIIEIRDGTAFEYEGNYSAWRKTREAELQSASDDKAAREAKRKAAERKQREAL